MAGNENLAGFRPAPGPDMISGATLMEIALTQEVAITGLSRLSCQGGMVAMSEGG